MVWLIIPDSPERVIEIQRAAIMVARSTKGLETALGLLLRILLMALPVTLILAGGGGLGLAICEQIV